jgi:hypothetical protein
VPEHLLQREAQRPLRAAAALCQEGALQVGARHEHLHG